MARISAIRSKRCRHTKGRVPWRLPLALLLGLVAAAVSLSPGPAAAQNLTFPERPKPPVRGTTTQGQMLVQAKEINYDYANERVSAVGNVQIYYNGSVLEANKVIYDQKTKRLRAEGNARLTEPGGQVSYGEIMELSDDYRDGFVDSLRVDAAQQTSIAAARAERSAGNFSIFHSGVYTACEACKEDPKKPPLWQVKAARIIHDQGEKMLYFEQATMELYGQPIAYLPYFSAPDPTVKRKTGFLAPTFSSSDKYRLRHRDPLFLGARSELRPHVHADDHDEAGPAARRRMAPAHRGRRLPLPRPGHQAVGPELLRA